MIKTISTSMPYIPPYIPSVDLKNTPLKLSPLNQNDTHKIRDFKGVCTAWCELHQLMTQM